MSNSVCPDRMYVSLTENVLTTQHIICMQGHDVPGSSTLQLLCLLHMHTVGLSDCSVSQSVITIQLFIVCLEFMGKKQGWVLTRLGLRYAHCLLLHTYSSIDAHICSFVINVIGFEAHLEQSRMLIFSWSCYIKYSS